MCTQENNSEHLNEWHKKSKFNESEVLASEFVGCFYCLSVFRVKEILAEMQWCDDHSKKGKTAICKKCFIDSILPLDFDGRRADRILESMNRKWFIDAESFR